MQPFLRKLCESGNGQVPLNAPPATEITKMPIGTAFKSIKHIFFCMKRYYDIPIPSRPLPRKKIELDPKLMG